MKSSTSPRYARDPEFIKELSIISDRLLYPDHTSPKNMRKTLARPSRRTKAIRALIDSSSLLDIPCEAVDDLRSPRQYGAMLTNIAIQDALDIYNMSKGTFTRKHDADTRAEILKSSGGSLLKIASIKESQKTFIMSGLAKYKYRRHPIELEDGKLKWIAPISDAIDEYRAINSSRGNEAVGCPMIQSYIELPDGRQSLVHHFWGRVVDIMLEIPTLAPQDIGSSPSAVCPHSQKIV